MTRLLRAADHILNRCVLIVAQHAPQPLLTDIPPQDSKLQSGIRYQNWRPLRLIGLHRVLSAFNSKPTCSKSIPPVRDLRGQIRMSSTKRKSSKVGPPSIKSMPACQMARLHFRIPNSEIAINNRGVKTQPCHTPPVMGIVKLNSEIYTHLQQSKTNSMLYVAANRRRNFQIHTTGKINSPLGISHFARF